MQKRFPPSPQEQVDGMAALLLVFVCALWGMNQVAIKVGVAGISPALQAGLRSLGSALLLLLWCRWRGERVLRRDGTLPAGLLAGVLFAAQFVALYWGLTYTTASRGVVFLFTAPFAVAVGAHWLVPGDRLTMLKMIGLVCAFAGVTVLFADALRLPSRQEVIGDALCLLAGMFWGATTVQIKASALAEIRAERTLLYQLAVSAPVLLVVAWLSGEAGVVAATPLVLGALAYQIVMVAFVSYAIWFWLVTRHPASRLAAFTFMAPLFGVAFGALLLDEPLRPALVLSAGLVALGIYLVNRQPHR